jgi:hypothetical protein
MFRLVSRPEGVAAEVPSLSGRSELVYLVGYPKLGLVEDLHGPEQNHEHLVDGQRALDGTEWLGEKSRERVDWMQKEF